MSYEEKAQQFRALHCPHRPVVLFNIWDAGGARTLTAQGAPAIATGSWAMASAHGFEDGERMPLSLALELIKRIVAVTHLPVTVDFEGGYAEAPADLAANAARLIEAGVVGLNFEDRVVNGSGLYSVTDQCSRIAAIRSEADARGVPLFINARTDIFFQDDSDHAALLEEAISRQNAYKEAGADGFFVPGLKDDNLVATLCATSSCPINVMANSADDDPRSSGSLGVARVSFGPFTFIAAQEDMARRAQAVLAAY